MLSVSKWRIYRQKTVMRHSPPSPKKKIRSPLAPKLLVGLKKSRGMQKLVRTCRGPFAVYKTFPFSVCPIRSPKIFALNNHDVVIESIRDKWSKAARWSQLFVRQCSPKFGVQGTFVVQKLFSFCCTVFRSEVMRVLISRCKTTRK